MINSPCCLRCKHLQQNKRGQVMRCEAFPQGIPQEILFGETSHLVRYHGDQGIVFEEATERDLVTA